MIARARVVAAARSAVDAALDLVLPPTCVACERLLSAPADALVCRLCWARVVPLAAPRCDRCGHPADGHACRWCPLLPPYVRAVRSSCWVSSGTALAIVHALKYGAWTAVAPGMAKRMGRMVFPEDVERERTAIVPVPLARDRERERGYNQSALLGEALATIWRIPMWSDVLQRSRRTETQTRLTPEQRRHNVSGAFRVAAGAGTRLRGAHVIIVDDVVTTAATLNACASALFDGGARIISYATFGRAPAIGDRVETTGELLDGNSRRH